MKKIKEIILIVFFILVINFIYIFTTPVVVCATDGDNLVSNISNSINSFQQRAQNKFNSLQFTVSYGPLVGIANFLYFALCVILIAGTFYKAIKYAMSSPSDRATAKKGLVGWVVLLVLGVGCVTFFRVLISSISNTSQTSALLNAFQNVTLGLSQNSVFMTILNTILRFFQVGAVGLAVYLVTKLGIKYFTASAREKADLKTGELQKTLIVVALAFGAFGFFNLLYQAFYG